MQTTHPEFKPSLDLFAQGLWLRIKRYAQNEDATELSEIATQAKEAASNPKNYLSIGIILFILLALVPWLALLVHELQLNYRYLAVVFFLFAGYCLFYCAKLLWRLGRGSGRFYVETCKVAYDHRHPQSTFT